MIQGAIDLYTELLPSHGERDEWGSTSLTNQPYMMRTSSERKYLLHNVLSQSCFLLLVALGEEREHIGKEKPKPGMGSGDNGMNVGKGDGSAVAEAAERWRQWKVECETPV